MFFWLRVVASRGIPSIASMRRIQHAHGQAVGRAGLQRVGDIQLERVFRAFVFADANPVQPDLRVIIHGEKTENETPVRMRVGRSREIMPIPDHPVVIGEDVLNDPRHLGRLGLGTRSFKPFLLSARVLRVGGDPPVRAVQRLRARGKRAEVYGFRLAAPCRRFCRVGQDGKTERARLKRLRPQWPRGHGGASELIMSRRQHRPDGGFEAVGGGQFQGGNAMRLPDRIHAGKRCLDLALGDTRQAAAKPHLDHGRIRWVNTREGVPARKVTLVLLTRASNFCAGVQSAPGWANALFQTRNAAMPPAKQRLS